jgi:predicted nucleotidyltransferase
MRTSIERTLGQMVERIVKRFAPERIILFGSHATGRAGPDSDVDLLVVMTPNGSKAEQELEILRLLRRYRVPKDVVVTTPEDFGWRRKVPGTIERPAALEGRVLYARR